MAFTDRLANRGSISTAEETMYSLLIDGDNCDGVITQTGGDRKKHTISFWHKRAPRWDYADGIQAQTGEGEADWSSNDLWGTQSEGDTLRFDGSKLSFFQEGGTGSNLTTKRYFRDYAAWYHIVIAIDTSQGTAANRVKMYINGVHMNGSTFLGTANYPDQNDEFKLMQNGENFRIGAGHTGNTNINGQGYYANFIIVDGAQKAATDFGEWDEDTPTIWKHKEYTGDYNTGSGTNGALYEFEGTAEGTGSTGTGQDTSGEGNHIDFRNHNGGVLDSPLNNFCVLQPTYMEDINNTAPFMLTHGSTKLAVDSSVSSVSWGPHAGSFQLSKGKWYWEMKWDSGYTFLVGVANASHQNSSSVYNYCTMYRPQNGNKYIDNTITSYGSSNSVGDVVGIALDLDNETLQAYINNSSEGAAFGLGTKTKASGYYVPMIWYGDTGTSTLNFGQSIHSSFSNAETDGDGYGSFQYSPPTGFMSLCTKNLAEYG